MYTDACYLIVNNIIIFYGRLIYMSYAFYSIFFFFFCKLTNVQTADYTYGNNRYGQNIINPSILFNKIVYLLWAPNSRRHIPCTASRSSAYCTFRAIGFFFFSLRSLRLISHQILTLRTPLRSGSLKLNTRRTVVDGV